MLKAARKSKNMSQKDLAKKLNLSQSYLCKLENKEYKNVTVELIKRISLELDLDLIEVFLYFCD